MGARFEALDEGALAAAIESAVEAIEIDWIFFCHFNFLESAVLGIRQVAKNFLGEISLLFH